MSVKKKMCVSCLRVFAKNERIKIQSVPDLPWFLCRPCAEKVAEQINKKIGKAA